MSESQDFHKFIIGETRVDNWKSDWRKDFEAYMAGKTIIPVFPEYEKKNYCRTAPVLKSKPAKDYMRQRRAWAIKNKMCTDCYHEKARTRKTTCLPCQKKRNARETKRHQKSKAA